MKKIAQKDMTLRALYEMYRKSIVTKGKITYRPYFMAKTNLFCGIPPEHAEASASHYFVRQEENCVYLYLEIKGITPRTFFAYPISESLQHQPYFESWLCDDIGSYIDTQDCCGELYWPCSPWQVQQLAPQAEKIFECLKAGYVNEYSIENYTKDQLATVFCENQDEEYVSNLFHLPEDAQNKAYINVVTPDMDLHDIVLLVFE